MARDGLMQITVKKLTDEELLRESAGMTTGHESHLSLRDAYGLEHSPMRTQMFWVRMEGIPTSSSVHLIRHHIWVEKFVKSNRPDRGGNGRADRDTPVDTGLFLNAQSLINMARMRLCNRADKTTREIMEEIKTKVAEIDADLAAFMVPNCTYRGGLCYRPCKYKKEVSIRYDDYRRMFTA